MPVSSQIQLLLFSGIWNLTWLVFCNMHISVVSQDRIRVPSCKKLYRYQKLGQCPKAHTNHGNFQHFYLSNNTPMRNMNSKVLFKSWYNPKNPATLFLSTTVICKIITPPFKKYIRTTTIQGNMQLIKTHTIQHAYWEQNKSLPQSPSSCIIIWVKFILLLRMLEHYLLSSTNQVHHQIPSFLILVIWKQNSIVHNAKKKIPLSYQNTDLRAF